MKFSILMPTFNRHQFIREAVDSILSQDEDLELIIKDGGEPCFNLLPRDKRIVYIHGKDKGITDAMNQSMKLAKGDIFSWANDDDLLSKDVLGLVKKEIGDKMWCYGIIEMTNGLGMGRPWDWNLMLNGNIVPQPTVYWKREAFNEIGLMDESEDLVSDYEYWLRLGSKWEPKFINKVMATYRVHDDQITSKIPQEQSIQAKRTAKKYA